MKDAGRIGFVIRGPYSALAQYEFLDIVYYGDASYVAKKDVSGITPEDESEYWQAFAKGWNSSGAVTGIKGAEEVNYRTGNVSLSAADIGALSATGKAQAALVADSVGSFLVFTGGVTGVYDGSEPLSVEIPHAVSVKGDAETEYRTGPVNITKGNIGLDKVANKSPEEIRAGLTDKEVIDALGYNPSSVTITVDDALSETSKNPVQNKAITGALAGKGDALVYDEAANELHLKSGESILSTVTIEGGSGGGMKLAGPTGVTLTNADEAVVIKWTDPADIVIQGATQAAWAGTLVVQKIGSAPTSKTDGVMVVDSKTRDAYKDTGFTDNGLTNGQTYYYGIFPYTTEKAYTYGTTKSITPEAIYPDAPTGISAVIGDEEATMGFSLPENATEAKICYSTQLPASLNSPYGTVIDNAISPYTIQGLTNGSTYYTAIFSVNAKGRTNHSNIYNLIPRAIYPDPPSDVSVKAGDGTITVSFSLPENATGAKIAYSTQQPESTIEPYGTVVSNIESPYTIAGLQNETEYYVTVYSTNAKGRDAAGEMMSATPTGTILFGFVIDQNESDPDSMITYIERNANFTPAHMDYANDRFDYGSWTAENGAWFMDVKPCMLNYDGTVAYYLDPNDYTKKLDGTPSDVANADFPGNAMVQIPKIYWKIVDNGDDTANVYICNRKLDESFACWSHIDANGNEINYCYMPCYNGSLAGDKLRSLSGKTLYGNVSMGTQIEHAMMNNQTEDVIWNIDSFADLQLINILLVLLSRTTDTQAAFGRGNSQSGQYLMSGTMDSKGLFWGDQSKNLGVKIFGIENWWGNQVWWVNGFFMVNGRVRVKMTHGTTDGSDVVGYNDTGNGYIDTGIAFNSEFSGYIKKMVFTKYGLIPKEVGGSSTTFYTDTLNVGINGTKVAQTGGGNMAGDNAGAFSSPFHGTFAQKYPSDNTSVFCKPLAPTGGENT